MSARRNVMLPRQAGLTLVELMVAMVLSLFVMAGAIAMFSGAKQTNALQREVSRVQSDGNAAMSLIEKQIRLAGYPEDSLSLQTGIVGDKGKAYPVQGTHVFTETVSTDDSLIVQFAAPYDNFRTCTGETFSEGDIISLRIALADVNADGVGTLQCQGATTTVDLIEGVSGLIFLYGEDGSDADRAPDDYVKYGVVTQMRNVVAIRLAFTVVSDHASVKERTFTTTIPMRNQVH